MTIKRRRVRLELRLKLRLGLSIGWSSSVEPDVWTIMFALVTGRVAAEHIGTRNLRERHDPAAIGCGKRRGGLAISEGNGLGRSHAALLAAFNDKERLARVDPVGRTRIIPARCTRHVRDV